MVTKRFIIIFTIKYFLASKLIIDIFCYNSLNPLFPYSECILVVFLYMDVFPVSSQVREGAISRVSSFTSDSKFQHCEGGSLSNQCIVTNNYSLI